MISGGLRSQAGWWTRFCALSFYLVQLASCLRQNQVSTATSYNRHGPIFREIAELTMGGLNASKVLSFGCSSGLEALTLANVYLHHSLIYAVDVNKTIIEQARNNVRANCSENRIVVFDGNIIDPELFGPYDLVTANNVLCRYPPPKTQPYSEVYPFQMFEDSVETLDKMLRPGGLLMITNGNYRMNDTKVGHKYSILLHSTHGSSCRFSHGGLPLMDRESRRVDFTTEHLEGCLWRKSKQ
jgi:chemotaxis methyl-accepting protein methylase